MIWLGQNTLVSSTYPTPHTLDDVEFHYAVVGYYRNGPHQVVRRFQECEGSDKVQCNDVARVTDNHCPTQGVKREVRSWALI